MTDPTSVIVPINLQAVIITQPVLNQYGKGGATNNYNNLLNSMEPPSPAAFAVGSGAKEGVHIHWTLPHALTHGECKLLFTAKDNVQEIQSDLEQHMVPLVLQKLFSSNNHALSTNTVVSV
jgi:hypothetical protein